MIPGDTCSALFFLNQNNGWPLNYIQVLQVVTSFWTHKINLFRAQGTSIWGINPGHFWRSWIGDYSTWVFPKIGVPQNGWFIMENPIKMDDLGGTTIFGNTHLVGHMKFKLVFCGPKWLSKSCWMRTMPSIRHLPVCCFRRFFDLSWNFHQLVAETVKSSESRWNSRMNALMPHSIFKGW